MRLAKQDDNGCCCQNFNLNFHEQTDATIMHDNSEFLLVLLAALMLQMVGLVRQRGNNRQ